MCHRVNSTDLIPSWKKIEAVWRVSTGSFQQEVPKQVRGVLGQTHRLEQEEQEVGGEV